MADAQPDHAPNRIVATVVSPSHHSQGVHRIWGPLPPPTAAIPQWSAELTAMEWSQVVRRRREASGDEHDLRALWQRAEGPYAPLAPPATVSPSGSRPSVQSRQGRGRTPRSKAVSSPSNSPPKGQHAALNPARR
jgi:hypothetical protein